MAFPFSGMGSGTSLDKPQLGVWKEGKTKQSLFSLRSTIKTVLRGRRVQSKAFLETPLLLGHTVGALPAAAQTQGSEAWLPGQAGCSAPAQAGPPGIYTKLLKSDASESNISTGGEVECCV